MKKNLFSLLLFFSLFFPYPQALAGSHELQHYNWDPSISGGDCGICHQRVDAFLKADYADGEEICQSCHTPTGVAHDKAISGNSHPVMVNATSGGNRIPTYGNVTAGEYNNQPFSRLKGGFKITCATCHNTMQKPEGPARTWEYTTTGDNITYALQNGGWPSQNYLEPVVYRDVGLWPGPTYSKSRKSYVVDPSEYAFNEISGFIRFKEPQPSPTYIYVTLDYPYLRASNDGNRLCSDCHAVQATHKGANCLACHQSHDTGNAGGIRENVRATDLTMRAVLFRNTTGMKSFADGDTAYDGICEVCHTSTRYYRRDGTGFANHSGGVCYDRKDCSVCHSHKTGFSTPSMIALTATDNGSTKNVAVGTEIEITLVSNSDGGYLWYVTGQDQNMVKLMGQILPGQAPGAPATQKFFFTTLAPGNTTLTLLEYRPWEGPGHAIDSFTVNLSISQ